MAKKNCVLCGKELRPFSSHSVSLCETSQSVCEDCETRYRQATEEEQILMREKMVLSPHLSKPETVIKNLPVERERWKCALEQEREQQERERERKERLSQSIRCCDREMTALGVSQFQLGEYGFLIGSWDNLASGSMELAMFRCECCGQIKFFDPDFVSQKD